MLKTDPNNRINLNWILVTGKEIQILTNLQLTNSVNVALPTTFLMKSGVLKIFYRKTPRFYNQTDWSFLVDVERERKTKTEIDQYLQILTKALPGLFTNNFLMKKKFQNQHEIKSSSRMLTNMSLMIEWRLLRMFWHKTFVSCHRENWEYPAL